jgi:hypothetical protein
MDVEGIMKDSVIVGLFANGFPAAEAFPLRPSRTTQYFHVHCRRILLDAEYSHARPRTLNGDIHA